MEYVCVLLLLRAFESTFYCAVNPIIIIIIFIVFFAYICPARGNWRQVLPFFFFFRFRVISVIFLYGLDNILMGIVTISETIK